MSKLYACSEAHTQLFALSGASPNEVLSCGLVISTINCYNERYTNFDIRLVAYTSTLLTRM